MTTKIAELFIRAVRAGCLTVVYEMLAAGVDVNIRLGDHSAVELDLESFDRLLDEFIRDQAQKQAEEALIERDLDDLDDRLDPGVWDAEEQYYNEGVRKYWYPIQHAAYLPDGDDSRAGLRDQMMNIILDHGPDLFAEYQARVNDCSGHLLNYLDGIDRPQFLVYDLLDCEDYQLMPRTVLHSLLEEGAYVLPILTHSSFKHLDLETRDSLGRTVFLAACRSRLGADANLDHSARGAYLICPGGGYYRNRIEAGADSIYDTFFEFFEKAGVDGKATDLEGKNAAHHLCESFDPVHPGHVPSVLDSCRRLGELIDDIFYRPDNEGTAPIHTAARRFMFYVQHYALPQWHDEEMLLMDFNHFLQTHLPGPEDTVQDGKLNTTLHYLAGLGYVWQPATWTIAQDLILAHLSYGPDPNIRNSMGRSSAEVLLGVDTVGDGMLEPRDDESREAELLVWQALDSAGVDWTYLDPQGRSLLHLLARSSDNWKAPLWVDSLIARGIDPSLIDVNGEDALAVARRCRNRRMVAKLESLPEATSGKLI